MPALKIILPAWMLPLPLMAVHEEALGMSVVQDSLSLSVCSQPSSHAEITVSSGSARFVGLAPSASQQQRANKGIPGADHDAVKNLYS